MNLCSKIFFPIFLLILLGSCVAPHMIKPGKTWAEQTLHSLTLREKIAQMMIYRMSMKFLNEESEKWQEIVQLIQSDGIGGIHLWYGEAGISMTMMNEMQRMSKVPILFDADIEYGMNQRFPAGTPLPPLMAITATGDPKYAYEVGKIAGMEARAVGILWNFSPVVDVNNNPENPIINTRSFGEDPERVGEFAIQFIRGLQDNGVAATAKHFPGHGDTDIDSHTRLATIPSDSARLWDIELKPFQRVIEAGVDAVMTAHIQSPDYQPHAETPATLSHFWINDILRKKLGFKGVIITDSMAMGGVTRNYTDAYALIAAINAGCDVIIQNYDLKKSVDTVEEAVRQGLIKESRINEAALRMLELKEKVGLHKQRIVNEQYTRQVFGKSSSQEMAKEIAQKAITLVKNEGDFLPLKLTAKDTLYVIDLYDYPYNHSQTLVTIQLIQSGINVKSFQIDESDDSAYYQTVLNAIPENAWIMINAFASPRARKDRIFLPEHQTQFINQVNEKSNRVLVTSFGNPYLIQGFPNTPAYLCAYKGHDLMQEAVVNALLGYVEISGILPVSIPGVAKAGYGINLPAKPFELEKEEILPSIVLKRAMPFEVGANIDQVRSYVNEAIADSAWPGCVLLAAKDGKIFIHEAFGFHTYDKNEPTTRGDIFDLASLTKVVATTSAIMKLYERGHLNLDDKVVTYIPEFSGPTPEQTMNKSTVTIKHLLTHTSGLPPFKRYYKIEGNVQTRLDSVYHTGLEYFPGDTVVYSDIGLIILGKIIEQVSGKTLDQFVREEIFQPLGMNSTYFNPPVERMKRIVPTEYNKDEGKLIRGQVHDENAYSLGGVAGHAGLFSTANDLAIFAQMMLNKGIYESERIFQPETIDLFTKRVNVVEESSRCLGWDSPAGKASGGVYLSDQSFGHTGFTGTSMWIDPENQMFVILLTNAVHPDRSWKSPKYYDWRQRIHAAVYESVGLTEKNPNLQWRERWVNP